jgi:ATP-binding cassette subfamily B protein
MDALAPCVICRLLHLAWSTSLALTLTCLSLRIVRAGVPAGWLYVAKLVVDAVVAGRADLTSSIAVTH